MYFTMIVLNTSKDFYATDGKVLVKPFKVEAGQIAYLTLTAPNSAKGRIEFPVQRVLDGVDCKNCPEYADSKMVVDHLEDGKPVALGYHKDGMKSVSDRHIIDWPGKYVIGTDMVQALNNPCQPIVIELHIEQRYQAVDPSA